MSVNKYDNTEFIDAPQEEMGFQIIENDTNFVVKEDYELFEVGVQHFEADDTTSLVEYVQEDEDVLYNNDNIDEEYTHDRTESVQVADVSDLSSHSLVMQQEFYDGVMENMYQCLECDVAYASPDEFARTHYQAGTDQHVIKFEEESNSQSEQPWEVVTEVDDELTSTHVALETSNNEFAQNVGISRESVNELSNDNVVIEEQVHENNYDSDELIKNELKNSADSDDGTDKYFCCDCRIVFNDLESAEVHNCSAMNNDNENTNQIEQTRNFEDHLKDFIETQNRSLHELTIKSSAAKIVTYNCNECTKVFTSVQALNSHSRLHKTKNTSGANRSVEAKEAICPICKTHFDSQKNLKLHMKIHEKKNLRSIEEALPAGAKLQYHEMNKFFCEICNKSFEQNLLGIHKNMHLQYMEDYNCHICNRHFENQLSYDMHMQMHAEKRPGPRIPVKLIQKTNDDNGKVKRFACQYCERTFTRPFEKVRHERVHTGEKPHSCEVCGKTFRVSYSLTLHLRTHTDIRPYVCPTCNKRFKSQQVYAHHLRIHQQERAYKCEQCQKTFRTSVQLSAHRKIHSKPYNCPVCNRPFASLYAVKIHMKTHNKLSKNSDETKHTCWLCGAIYARVSALRCHMKEIHSIDMETNEELELQNRSIVIEDDDEVDEEAAVLIAAAAEADCAAYMEASTAATASHADEVFPVILQNDEIILDNYQTEEIVAD